MERILVTYATMAGSTVEVAQAIAETIEQQGLAADLRPIAEVASLDGYAGVVVAAPMIMGWHRAALGFLRRHRREWARVPVAACVTAMSLTRPEQPVVGGLPVVVDDRLTRPPVQPGRLSFKERYAQLANYVRPIMAAARPARPASVGVFGGRLEYGRLRWWAVLFAMFVVRAPAGDRRNWPAIRTWAAGLPAAFAAAQASPAFAK